MSQARLSKIERGEAGIDLLEWLELHGMARRLPPERWQAVADGTAPVALRGRRHGCKSRLDKTKK